MLSIFATTESRKKIEDWVQKADPRLFELLHVEPLEKRPSVLSFPSLMVQSSQLLTGVDWGSNMPPYLLPQDLPFNESNAISLIYFLLGGHEEAFTHLDTTSELRLDLHNLVALTQGLPVSIPNRNGTSDLPPFDQYRALHNRAILMHYGILSEGVTENQVKRAYRKALEEAPNDLWKAYTARQMAILLGDLNQSVEARTLIEPLVEIEFPEAIRMALKADLSRILMAFVQAPLDTQLVNQLKSHLWDALTYFEQGGRKVEAGLLLSDATQIASIEESFSEALGYINKAITFFSEEGLEELLADAQIKKGTLLYTWGQAGNPQFFQASIKAFQEALHFFRKDSRPDVFAEIHHRLGVLYAELPAENKKRGIWAGVSASSFQEALNYYTKTAHPLIYARICSNYGNALSRFPPSIHSDNYEKALFYYQEALDVRQEEHPYERAITLLNFLEASWNVGNSDESFNEQRFTEMIAKANEVKTLVKDPELIAEADNHLHQLAQLKSLVNNT